LYCALGKLLSSDPFIFTTRLSGTLNSVLRTSKFWARLSILVSPLRSQSRSNLFITVCNATIDLPREHNAGCVKGIFNINDKEHAAMIGGQVRCEKPGWTMRLVNRGPAAGFDSGFAARRALCIMHIYVTDAGSNYYLCMNAFSWTRRTERGSERNVLFSTPHYTIICVCYLHLMAMGGICVEFPTVFLIGTFV